MTVPQLYWSEEYSIGDPIIDKEHQLLFHLANEVYNLIGDLKHLTPQKVKKCTDELCNFIRYHFKHEQELMDHTLYLDIYEHIKYHDRIITNMNKILTTSPDHTVLCTKLYELVVDWVYNHVMVEDRKIVFKWTEELPL